MSLSDADRLRVAVVRAISLLKFKPSDRSCSSYVRDVQDKFSSPSPEETKWRERALKLEHEIENLRAKYESEHIKLLALSEGSPSGQEELQGAKKVKKKSWQQQQADSGSMQIGEGIKNVNASYDIPSVTGGISMLTCFDNLNQLIEIIDGGGGLVATDLVISTADRALQSVGALLGRLLGPVNEDEAGEIKKKAEEAVATASQLTCYVMTSILPCLREGNQRKKRKVLTWTGTMTSCTAVDEILRLVAKWVCIPVIRSFYSLSIRWTSRSFVTMGGQKEKRPSRNAIDLRPNLGCLVKDVVMAVEELLVGARGADGLREILGVETVRELKKMEEESCCGEPDLDERVRRLAKKDAFWYFCDLVGWLFGEGRRKVSVPLGEEGEALRQGIVRMLSKLVTDRYGRTGKGTAEIWNGDGGGGCKGGVTVERGMLFAVLEKVWMFWVVPDE